MTNPGPDQDGQGEAGAAQDQAAPCRLCEAVPAVLGLLAAAVIVFVSLDLLTGGRLTVTALGLIGKGPADEPAD